MVFVGWGATPAARFPQYEEVAFEERSPLGVPFSFAAAQAQPNTGVGLLYEKASLTLRSTQPTKLLVQKTTSTYVILKFHFLINLLANNPSLLAKNSILIKFLYKYRHYLYQITKYFLYL
mgnify:CR=1 FL=1